MAITLKTLKKYLLFRDVYFPIEEINKDQFPKFVVTMDDFWKESIEGVQHFYISDFLLSDQF
ncbi:MAG: hypothetical protein LBU83_06425 [Bacteroidales bacterium]|jgi:hypothetical protein|nr:hypothetical protein [Bacteroidales bacterium]